MASEYPKISQFKSVDQFRQRLQALGIELPVDDEILAADRGSPLAQALSLGPLQVGNRWCVHPMEGWDANTDGSPSELTLRRWRNFGRSGAKLIWGGEAAAVRADGRANPRQTLGTPQNRKGLQLLRETACAAHEKAFGNLEGFVIGLQLTHSGRFCRPHSKQLEPRIAYHHPLLDEKFGIDADDDSIVWSDTDLEALIDNYVAAAKTAAGAGFQFVDIKACHGYLLHEFLSARVRLGKFGGDFNGRTRLLLTIIDRVHAACPQLSLVVRLSVFDSVPFKTSREVGQPMAFEELLPYQFAFGVDPERPCRPDLTEPIRLLRILAQKGIVAVNVSCGSPYYNPHMQRPAIFPPSDGYLPPEDPLVGVARQIDATRQCKIAVPEMPMVGTGYSYLQEFLPHVAQASIRAGWVDAVGLGRVVLSYPELPADTLAGKPMKRKSVCRTFSDCTTGPRHGLVSGCYPLDDYYKRLPEAEQLKRMKRNLG